MTANQRQRKCLVEEANKLFLIADVLKTQSNALVRRAGELRNAMRVSQSNLHRLRGNSGGIVEAVPITTGA